MTELKNLDFNFPGVACEFFTVQSFNDGMENNINDIIVLHINIRSFNANFSDLSCLIDQLGKPIDIIAMSETWFTGDYTEDIVGYDAFHSYRVDRAGGGVSLFVRKKLHCTCVPLLSQSSSILEMVGVTLLTGHSGKLNVICAYRPPARDKIADFNIELEVLLHSIRSSNNILCGDLNIDPFWLDCRW